MFCSKLHSDEFQGNFLMYHYIILITMFVAVVIAAN